MQYKKLIPTIYVKDETAYSDKKLTTAVDKDLSVTDLCNKYFENGADGIVFTDLSYDDLSHEKAINILREVCKAVDIPVYACGNIKRVEDVKKYIYAGAKAALLNTSCQSNLDMMTEVKNRFGKDKVGTVSYECINDTSIAENIVKEELEVNITYTNEGKLANYDNISFIYAVKENFEDILSHNNCAGITSEVFSATYDFMSLKHMLKNNGINVNVFTSSMSFGELKTNSDGLIPVVVQDYLTDEVLMLAYMNEEAFDNTIKTGRMTYYSRSRQEQWVKGMTSGHFQYIISMEIDCDNDTLLAKVRQVGAACHTGNRSCFYRNLYNKEVSRTNPLRVFNSVMDVIEDRKIHPKEGSYTNYLFDKGIDKILKKVGEEASEIIIAAKNPDPVEVKYEISDFLYHVMVLMVEKGLTWEDIVEELANR